MMRSSTPTVRASTSPPASRTPKPIYRRAWSGRGGQVVGQGVGGGIDQGAGEAGRGRSSSGNGSDAGNGSDTSEAGRAAERGGSLPARGRASGALLASGASTRSG